MKKRVLNYNVLWTHGDKESISRNRHHIKDIYKAHLWVHNGEIEKNHTTLEEDRLPHICNLSNIPFILENTIDEWDESRDSITVNTEDYIYCERCEIDNTGERMCPCPRGGCEAEVMGTIKTTIEVTINEQRTEDV